MEQIANRWKLIDPEPDVRGVLLSDRIESYVRNLNLLIDGSNFKTSNLKPASYLLTLGREYYLNGEFLEVGWDGFIVIPPNSFVVATTNERIVLPHWCAARYGARVNFVYRGILVGAGPQVDPGFEGYLGCPIHNLTDRPLKLRVGESFAWIDFTKTSRLGEVPGFGGSDDSIIHAAALKKRDRYEGHAWVISGCKGFECRLYETARHSFKDSMPPGETISSSVKGLENEIERVKDDWTASKKSMDDRLDKLDRVSHNVNIAAVAGLVAVLISVVLTIGVELFMPRRTTVIKLEQRIAELERKIEGNHLPVVIPEKAENPIPASTKSAE